MNLLTVVGALAQIPWTVVPTSNSQEIVLQRVDSSLHYDGSFNVIGDAIGFFYDQGGTLTCAGYFEIDGTSQSFTIYGNDGVDNGFQNFESYTIYYYHLGQNCIIQNTVGSMSNNQFFSGGSDTIYVIGAFPAVVEFSSNFICRFNTAALPIPIQVTNTLFSNLNFASTPTFAGFNSTVGEIQNFSDPDGQYYFTVETLDGMCLRSTDFTITLGSKLMNNPVIEVIAPTCKNKTGVVNIDTSFHDIGMPPFSFQLKSLSNLDIITSLDGKFPAVDPGNYELIISDLELCADTIPVTMPLSSCSDAVREIITPNSDNEFSSTNLPWEGETKIYNSQWQLVNVLKTPTHWSGKDSEGNSLQTGVYFIFTNGKLETEVTVVDEKGPN